MSPVETPTKQLVEQLVSPGPRETRQEAQLEPLLRIEQKECGRGEGYLLSERRREAGSEVDVPGIEQIDAAYHSRALTQLVPDHSWQGAGTPVAVRYLAQTGDRQPAVAAPH